MTFYEKTVVEISSVVSLCLPKICDFTVDIPTFGDGDFYSNAMKICGENFRLDIENSVLSSYCLDNGFLNFKLKDEVFYQFLSEFELTDIKTDDEFLKKISAYVQLAENEKKLEGEVVGTLPLTSTVRRILVCLMKFQYICLHNAKKSKIIRNEIIRLLDGLEAESENLKSFVIIYEPLLIAVRGSLVKL